LWCRDRRFRSRRLSLTLGCRLLLWGHFGGWILKCGVFGWCTLSLLFFFFFLCSQLSKFLISHRFSIDIRKLGRLTSSTCLWGFPQAWLHRDFLIERLFRYALNIDGLHQFLLNRYLFLIFIFLGLFQYLLKFSRSLLTQPVLFSLSEL